MREAILCLAAFLLLTWVIYLKIEMVKLLEQNEKLAALLKVKLDKEKAEMEVGGPDQVFGRKPHWMK